MIFGQQHVRTIRALAEGIFPADGAIPSAAGLPVTEMFIEVAGTWPEDIVVIFQQTLDLLNSISLQTFGIEVPDLDESARAVFIDIIANEESLNAFWEPFRTLIAFNYYGLPPAYLAIGRPGPKIDAGGFDADGAPARENIL